MTKLPRISAVAVLAAALLASVPSLAAPPAQSTLKTKQAEITALVKKDDKPRLDKAFDEILDYDALAKDSLGELWSARSAEERAEFQKLLTQLVRGAYRKSIKRTLGYDIQYKGESKLDAAVLVRTVAQNRSNAREEPVSLDYAMHQVNGQWRIRDIVTDGSSLVRNYQNQFRRIVKQHGFPELLVRMRKKIDKGEVD